MTPSSRVRVALATGLGLLVAGLPAPGDVRWSWLLWTSLGLSTAGIGIALAVKRTEAGLVALTLILLGWFLRIHSINDGLPVSPQLARPFDLNPTLGCALGAAGLQLLTTGGDGVRARRMAGFGALLFLAAALYPQVHLGSVILPLFAAHGWLNLALLVTAALLIRPAARVREIAIGCLAIVPVWMLFHLDWHSALLTTGDTLAIAGGLVLWAREPAHRLTETIAVVLIAVFWWLLKLHGLGYAGMDEYIYFYAANAWAHGLWPYRDFFFSHPPIHIAVPMVLFILTGFQNLLAKLVAPTALFIAGLVLWRSARRHFGSLAAIFSLMLFWFASEVLVASTTFTGVELTTLFLSLGIVAALDRRAFTAGVWFGVAACTGVYGIAGFFTFGVLSLAAPIRKEGAIPARRGGHGGGIPDRLRGRQPAVPRHRWQPLHRRRLSLSLPQGDEEPGAACPGG